MSTLPVGRNMKYTTLVLALLVTPALLNAQSTLSNTPNIATGWTASKHEMLFDLVHRFSIGAAPSRKVSNASTLGVYVGVTEGIQAGLTYASASEINPAKPNEFEFSARMRGLRQGLTGPIDLYVQGAWNKTAGSADAQIYAGRRFGDIRVMVAGTWLGDAFGSGEGRGAIGGGALIPLHKGIAIAGDASTFIDRADGEKITWSAGLQLGITDTPHTLSIHVSNVAGRTLQGSLLASATRRVGFEYTIPLTFGARRKAIEGSGSHTAALILKN